jgi:aconitate hydratase
MTLTHRILSDHLVEGQLVTGEEVQLRVDQALLQDATGTMACLELEQLGARASRDAAGMVAEGQATRPALDHLEALGVERIGIPFGIVYVVHNILAVDFKNPDDHRFLRTFCAAMACTIRALVTGSATTCTSSASRARPRCSWGRTATPRRRARSV